MTTQLNTQTKDNTLIVELPHDFSGMNVDKYREQFELLADVKQEKLVLDFTSTEFIDSSGIGAMVFLYKKIEKRGISMKLLNVEGQPNKLMKLLRVEMTIPFITELDCA